MSKSVKAYAGWLLALAIVSMSIGIKAFADSTEFQPVLLFRVINSVQISDEVVQIAKKHVQRIYLESGIQVEWMANDEAIHVWDGRKKLILTIGLVSESLARVMGQPDSATGFAISNNGRGARHAYIFVERSQRQADTLSEVRQENKPFVVGLVLGHVIAHEAGHLMLPQGAHSPIGIMSAKMDPARLQQALQGALLFTAKQSQLMRTALMDQSEF